MITPMQIYWISRLDAINGVFIALGSFCLAAVFMFAMNIFLDGADRVRNVRNIHWFSLAAFVFGLLALLTPSKEDVTAMISARESCPNRIVIPLSGPNTEPYSLTPCYTIMQNAETALQNAPSRKDVR